MQSTGEGQPTQKSVKHALHWLTRNWIWQRTAGDDAIRGTFAALISPLFLGLAPVFAKQAYHAGADADVVIAMRMTLAVSVLWAVYLLFARRFIHTWWLGVTLSSMAGAINGMGSICYYQGLARIDASLASLLNISYLVFVTLILRILGQKISILTLFRLLLAGTAVFFLSQATGGDVDPIGVVLLLAGALAYSIQLVIGQRVLYDIPAPTMTLYSVSAMALVVNVTWILGDKPTLISVNSDGWHALLAFAGVTALSRLTLFMGVKHLGSIQTAALGVSEALVTVLLSMVLFGEMLHGTQWVGAGLMILSVMLLVAEKDIPQLIPIPLLTWVIKLSTKRVGIRKIRGGK